MRSFQSGISIFIQNFSLFGDGEILLTSQEAEPSVIAFLTYFSGVGHISYATPDVCVEPRLTNIEVSEYKPIDSIEVASNTPIQLISVCMEPDIFSNLTGKSSDELVDDLEFLNFNKGKPINYSRLKSMDFALKICAYQAYDTFLNNPNDSLFLEAKALELVALQINQLELLTGKRPQEEATDRSAEKISCACDILAEEMANPPKALELAHRVGLNHKQLVQGFKKVFGVSPFEYLRIIRLEKARDLIASHDCNITEAAFNVGYSSLSHFCRSFREEFGINPKACA
jgi:AraC-like DNA-binding protein